jgi:acyl-CoA reductase-like NAD-dependent aldehyde dehydrogenase
MVKHILMRLLSKQVVFNGADFDKAAPQIVKAIVQNAGQTCSAGSRLLNQEDIYHKFIEKVARLFKDKGDRKWLHYNERSQS